MDCKMLIVLSLCLAPILHQETPTDLATVVDILTMQAGTLVSISQRQGVWEVEIAGLEYPHTAFNTEVFCRQKKQHVLCRTLGGSLFL